MFSLVDSAIDAAMGTLTETHGVVVAVHFAELAREIMIRGIYNANAIITTMSAGGIPIESAEIQIGFQKSAFIKAGVREPAHGDIVNVPNIGMFIISRIASDDGIELVCGLKKDVGDA